MTLVTFQIPTFAVLMGVWVCRVLGRNFVKLEVIQLIDFCPMCYFCFIQLPCKRKKRIQIDIEPNNKKLERSHMR